MFDTVRPMTILIEEARMFLAQNPNILKIQMRDRQQLPTRLCVKDWQLMDSLWDLISS